MAELEMKVGERIRTYRGRLDMSVEALAEASGIGAKVIEAIEGGEAYPALGVLVRLSRALGQRLGTFMDDQQAADPVVVRAEDRTARAAPHKGASTEGLRYSPLGRGKSDRHMEPFFINVDPGCGAPLSSHEGEEFLFVLSGEALLVYGNEEHALRAGDSVYYNSLVPHAVRSHDGQPATLVASVFMPL
ncbi:MAG: cupin domain-containing protein [Kiritimatiellaeota bacterium]|nr:cupin domain-containing protein [Kiritimatiellota bacterium]